VLKFINFRFALFTPPLGDFHMLKLLKRAREQSEDLHKLEDVLITKIQSLEELTKEHEELKCSHVDLVQRYETISIKQDNSLLLLGACFFAEGPLSKLTHKQTQYEGTGRSYDPGSFGIVICIETKVCTDLKRKRPISP
jgi:hypothetical protein